MTYNTLTINQKVNAKGNATFLYTAYNPRFLNMTPFGLLKRVARRDPRQFTPEMLLDNNTKTI